MAGMNGLLDNRNRTEEKRTENNNSENLDKLWVKLEWSFGSFTRSSSVDVTFDGFLTVGFKIYLSDFGWRSTIWRFYMLNYSIFVPLNVCPSIRDKNSWLTSHGWRLAQHDACHEKPKHGGFFCVFWTWDGNGNHEGNDVLLPLFPEISNCGMESSSCLCSSFAACDTLCLARLATSDKCLSQKWVLRSNLS